MPIFASSADDEFRALPLPEPVPDLVRIGSELARGAARRQLGRDGSLVVVVSRERGTVYRFAAGRLVEIVDETEETPGRHTRAAGRRRATSATSSTSCSST